MNKTCETCGFSNNINAQNIHIGKDCSFVLCEECFDIIIVDSETCGRDVILQSEIPPLNITTVVIIDNKEHPLHNKIGIIKDKKHKHYRIEFDNGLVWIPEHWVKQHEPDDND